MWFVVLRLGQKPPWVSSSYISVVSRSIPKHLA